MNQFDRKSGIEVRWGKWGEEKIRRNGKVGRSWKVRRREECGGKFGKVRRDGNVGGEGKVGKWRGIERKMVKWREIRKWGEWESEDKKTSLSLNKNPQRVYNTIEKG